MMYEVQSPPDNRMSWQRIALGRQISLGMSLPGAIRAAFLYWSRITPNSFYEFNPGRLSADVSFIVIHLQKNEIKWGCPPFEWQL